jgi:uncharacterized protein (TIGR03067 family)
MKLRAVLVVAVGFLIAADAKDDGAKDKEKIKGVWKIVSGEQGGKALPEDKLQEVANVEITDTKIILKAKGKEEAVAYTLDPTKKPTAIDLVQRDEKLLGIYQLAGDDLKICWNEPGDKDRPTEFATKNGSQTRLLVLKRAKK